MQREAVEATAFSFLIAAPTINEVAVVTLYGLFGWRVAGLIIAISAGAIIGQLKLERYVEDFVWQLHAAQAGLGGKLAWSDRITGHLFNWVLGAYPEEGTS